MSEKEKICMLHNPSLPSHNPRKGSLHPFPFERGRKRGDVGSKTERERERGWEGRAPPNLSRSMRG